MENVDSRWALIMDGAVVEITEIDPDGRFHESFVWVQADANVRVGSLYHDGVFSAVPDDTLPPEIEKQRKESLVRQHLDATARVQGFDSLSDALTYVDEGAVPQFQSRAQALRAWRSLVWDTANGLLSDMQNLPTDEDLIGSLPEFPG